MGSSIHWDVMPMDQLPFFFFNIEDIFLKKVKAVTMCSSFLLFSIMYDWRSLGGELQTCNSIHSMRLDEPQKEEQ